MSREKGSVAERQVAAILERWWRQLEPDARFVRTPLSGGWHGPDVRTEFRASGDLMTTAQRFPFAVEVKRREAWSFEEMVAGRASPVWAWWRQAQGQAREMRCEPLLVFRRNREGWHAMLREDYARAKLDALGPRHKGLVFGWNREGPLLGQNFGEHWPGLLDFNHLLAVPPLRFVSV